MNRLRKAQLLGMVTCVAATVASAATCIWTGSWDQTPSSTTDVINISSGSDLVWSNTFPYGAASWTQDSGYNGTVMFTSVYGTNGFTNFTISGDALIMGGKWTHQTNASTETSRLRVSIGGNLLVTNATISADSKGFISNQGYVTASVNWDGGTYGGIPGYGGRGITYGSIASPTNLGSGGYGSKGAGAILLTVAGTTTVATAGIITAGGETNTAGGGAGGSIFLTTGWIQGGGAIRAHGGNATAVNPAAGGGGRVAILLTGANANFTGWTGTHSAQGGFYGTTRNGAAGTVYLRDTAGNSSLIVDNNGITAPALAVTLMPKDVNLNSFSNVVIHHQGVLGVKGDTTLDFNTLNLVTYGSTQSFLEITSDTNVVYPSDWIITNYTLRGQGITKTLTNLTLGSDGVLTHRVNGATNGEPYKLTLTIVSNLTVMSNGAISATAKGRYGGYGPGTPGASGAGWDGGAYAGLSGYAGGKTYGSVFSPTNVGSGGRYSSGYSGGAILLNVAGTTTVAAAGAINAGGLNSDNAGSGGSVFLRTGWLAGGGVISAHGGNATTYAGGGGGRVAIVLTDTTASFSTWTGTHSAYGGIGVSAANGAAGTVYLQDGRTGSGQGTVIVSNNAAATSATVVTRLPSDLNTTEDLKASIWVVGGKARLEITTNVLSVQLGYLTVSNGFLNLRGRSLSVLPDLNVNGTLYGVGSYATNDLAGTNITDSVGGGRIEVRPAVDNASGATAVSQTSASLNGNLYAADASSTALFVLWGLQDAGTNLGQWAHTNAWPAPQSAGLFTTNVTSPALQANAVHYYRFYTTNSLRQNLALSSSAFMTADVWVEKAADASELGLVPGAFTLHRHPDATNGAITVRYIIGGSAKPGTNYVNNLGTNFTFATGVSQTNIIVTPLLDEASTSNETVVLTLTAGAYSVGSPGAATVTVFNLSMPSAPTNVWIGSGNANQTTNWSLGHAPTNTETVYLSGYSKASVVWDSTNAVAAWMQTAQYTGTVAFATVYPSKGAFTNFNILGHCALDGGRWAHLANSTSESNRLSVSIGGNLVLGSNTAITVDTLGWSPNLGQGKGSVSWDGGSYGGLSGYASGTTYGSIPAPTNLGSGGAVFSGGGAILLNVAGTTTLAAASAISANGQSGANDGPGSGGSVFLTTDRLTGSGSITANGGNPTSQAGGGGGRVAIVLTGADADFSLWVGTNSAYGGAGAITPPAHGAAGTVYRRTAAGVDSLIIDNNGLASMDVVTTLMPDDVNLCTYSNVIVHHKGVLGVKGNTTLDFGTFNLRTNEASQSYLVILSDTNVVYPSEWTIAGYTLRGEGITKALSNLTIASDGILTHRQNGSNGGPLFQLNLTMAGNLTILSNGSISAYAKGYVGGQGPGVSAIGWDGGAHGGLPCFGGGQTYGSIFAPTNIGSGGIYSGGYGGGSIRLTVAGTTTVASAGTIDAGGLNADSPGSGGSVYLRTGWLAGGGQIRAHGGNPASNGANSSGGGGGRVALVLTGGDFATWTGSNLACGGAFASAKAGAAGTVYLAAAGVISGHGIVLIDNGNSATNVSYTSLPAFTNSTENLEWSYWAVLNKGRIGLLTNATVWSLSLSNNAYLALAGQTLTVRKLVLTNTVCMPGVYAANQLGALVTDSAAGLGRVEVLGEFEGSVFFMR